MHSSDTLVAEGRRGDMRVLVIDRSKIACHEMAKYLDGLGHDVIAVNRVEDAIDTISVSRAWVEQFGAIILTADPEGRTPIMWFLKYLHNRHKELGVIPTLLQSTDDLYLAEGDQVDLTKLSERHFPFVWYHRLNLKKLSYFKQFFSEWAAKPEDPTH
jgi:hypothetical protein